jgi:hypothetical protein
MHIIQAFSTLINVTAWPAQKLVILAIYHIQYTAYNTQYFIRGIIQQFTCILHSYKIQFRLHTTLESDYKNKPTTVISNIKFLPHSSHSCTE